MEVSGLQRSEISFRRSGSSGLIWDDKLFSGELKAVRTKDEEDREKDESKGIQQAYRAIEVAPTGEPPSPKVSGCGGLCGMFAIGKSPQNLNKRKPPNRKSN